MPWLQDLWSKSSELCGTSQTFEIVLVLRLCVLGLAFLRMPHPRAAVGKIVAQPLKASHAKMLITILWAEQGACYQRTPLSADGYSFMLQFCMLPTRKRRNTNLSKPNKTLYTPVQPCYTPYPSPHLTIQAERFQAQSLDGRRLTDGQALCEAGLVELEHVSESLRSRRRN